MVGWISCIAVAPQPVQIWVRTYRCSHQALPPMAVGNNSPRMHVAVRWRSGKKPWRSLGLADAAWLPWLITAD